MSEKLTRIRLKGSKNSGYLDWGEHSFEAMVAKVRALAQYDLEKAQEVLNAPQSAFEVDIVRGPIVQRFVRKVEPSATPTSPLVGEDSKPARGIADRLGALGEG